MNYWPLSTIKESPLMSAAFAHELFQVYKTCYLTPAAFHACGDVARHTQPLKTRMVVIESTDAPARQAYTEYPTWAEWSRLERGGVIEASNGAIHVIIDALH